MMTFVFALSITAAGIILCLSVISLFARDLQFWPPPDESSWQSNLFWSLFRLMFGSLMVLCVLDYAGIDAVPLFQTILGTFMAVAGFGSAFALTYDLGWGNAHGSTEGLKTDGWYRWSRNPIYIVTIVGMIGLGVAINSRLVNFVLVIWAAFYILAPFLEEPWLEKHYGDSFRAYKQTVPRFLGRTVDRT
ncbi:MAG TPA: methyltransferase [Caldilineaceae bacterium]|nr:methyltransferase [Caldilineaceae bacterium]